MVFHETIFPFSEKNTGQQKEQNLLGHHEVSNNDTCSTNWGYHEESHDVCRAIDIAGREENTLPRENDTESGRGPQANSRAPEKTTSIGPELVPGPPMSPEAEPLLPPTGPSDLAGPSSSMERGRNEGHVAHQTEPTHTWPTR